MQAGDTSHDAQVVLSKLKEKDSVLAASVSKIELMVGFCADWLMSETTMPGLASCVTLFMKDWGTGPGQKYCAWQSCMYWGDRAIMPCLSDLVGAVQRLAMSEASPLYKKLTEEEKAGYVKLAEGTHAHHSHKGSWMGTLGCFQSWGAFAKSWSYSRALEESLSPCMGPCNSACSPFKAATVKHRVPLHKPNLCQGLACVCRGQGAL